MYGWVNFVQVISGFLIIRPEFDVSKVTETILGRLPAAKSPNNTTLHLLAVAIHTYVVVKRGQHARICES